MMPFESRRADPRQKFCLDAAVLALARGWRELNTMESSSVNEMPSSSRLGVPEAGQVARVRTRTHLVDSVQPSPGTGTLVRMSCFDDDAQGQPLEVVWELELDPEILDREAWQSIGKRGFDNARHFSAFNPHAPVALRHRHRSAHLSSPVSRRHPA